MIPIKSRHDLKKQRSACDVVREVHEKLALYIKAGVTTKDIDKYVDDIIISRAGVASFKGYHGYPACSCISVNSTVIHGIPGEYVISEGDIVSVDVGVYKDGFHGDAARTFAVGEVGDDASRLIRVTEESFFKGIDCFEIGGLVSDISRAVQVHVEAAGFSVVRDFVGHGIGVDLHEPPSIPNFVEAAKGARLKAGMVFAVEPMVNAGHHGVCVDEGDGWTVRTLDGSLSAHYENTVALTRDGVEILTL